MSVDTKELASVQILRFPCHYCKAAPGAPCVTVTTGRPAVMDHANRYWQWRRATDGTDTSTGWPLVPTFSIATQKLVALGELHVKSDYRSRLANAEPYYLCDHCGYEWPCATIRILNGDA